MLAYFVLLLAVLSRILPHAFGAVNWNFTALGGGLLFFGSRMAAGQGTLRNGVKLASALAVLIATDYYLTVYAFGLPFRVSGYLVTWVWYAAVCLLGKGILQKVSALRVAAGVLASATSFFLLSNFMYWIDGGGFGAAYPHTLAGLGACYVAGLPFYRNDLVSTAITAGALFGLPALATRLVDMVHSAHHNDLPLG